MNLTAGHGQSLRLGIRESDDAVWAYKIRSVYMKKIERRCRETIEGINSEQGKTRGGSLRQMGQMLSSEFLTPDIRETLLTTGAENLILELDDHTVHIPWELLCIGNEFLCQRFNMGRRVRTAQEVVSTQKRSLSKPLDMWIVADPGEDLPAAGSEGEMICKTLDQVNAQAEPLIFADMDPEVRPDEMKERIKEYDILHFAGHANYHSRNPERSGWRLTDGSFTSGDIAGHQPMPALIFSNACQSARTGRWQGEHAGLVNAFMLAGVKHYLGTSWEITDEPGSSFASLFYDHLLAGKTVGESVRLARIGCMKGRDISWASYLLYGDPTFSYFGEKEGIERSIRLEITASHAAPNPPRRWLTCLMVIGFLLAAGVATYLTFKPSPESPPPPDMPKILRLFDEFGRLLENVTASSFKAPKGHKEKLISQSVGLLDEIQASASSLAPDEAFEDDWTSGRVAMAVIYDPKKGNEVLAAFAVQKSVHDEYPRVKLLDRKSLDEIRKEFELMKSDLVRPENRLTPDLWTVRLFLVLEAVNSEVVMRLDETKTGKILDFFHVRLESGKSSFDQKEKLTEKLLGILRKRYPLRGRIAQVIGQEVILNIGEDVGVRIGQRFRDPDGDMVLRVVSLRAGGTSTAQVEKGDDVPEKRGGGGVFSI